MSERQSQHKWPVGKIKNYTLTTDYVANGSFASLRENVEYLQVPGYAILVRLTDYTNGWKGNYVYVSEAAYNFLAKSTLEPGDIVISNVGDPGRAFLVPNLGMPMTIGPNSILVRTLDRKKLLMSYLYWYITSPEGQASIQRIVTSTAQRKFNKTSFRELEIPLPPLAEQKRIAAILDKADAIRRKRNQALKLADDFLRATFLDMFGDPVTNPMGWEVVCLSDLGKVKTGNTPSRKKKEYYGNKIEWIKSDNINTPFHYLTKAEEGLSMEGKAVARTVPPYSTLVTCIAGSFDCIGNAALSDREVAFNQQINAITPKEGTDPFFLYCLILNSKKKIQYSSTNSMKGMVSKGNFEKIKFYKPPVKLQREFRAFFEKYMAIVNSSVVDEQNGCELFNSLTQRAFRGEL